MHSIPEREMRCNLKNVWQNDSDSDFEMLSAIAQNAIHICQAKVKHNHPAISDKH